MGTAIGKSVGLLMLGCISLFWTGPVEKLAAQQPQAGGSLSIEQIAAERDRNLVLPRQPRWSPDGESLGFIQMAPITDRSEHGAKPSAIWSIDAKTGRQSSLVTAAELAAVFPEAKAPLGANDEDQSDAGRNRLQDYAWAPDGHALLVATGVSLAWFDLGKHSSRLVVKDAGPLGDARIGPNGRVISFIRGHSLWLAEAATGKSRLFAGAGHEDLRKGEPDWVYDHELGLHSAYWWSPDSTAIAWLEFDDRAVDKYTLRPADGDESTISYPKPGGAIPAVRLVVQRLSGGKPVRIDLGNHFSGYIPRVEWLPDSKHLAVERLDRGQKTLELLVADAATGISRTILTEKDAYWINLSGPPLFFKDSHRFLWSSERSGFRHLYLYDISGRQLAQVTQGNWEVTALDALDEANGMVYFTATQASPLERQLYRANLDGQRRPASRKSPEPTTRFAQRNAASFLTRGPAIHPRRMDLRANDGTGIATLNRSQTGDAISAQLRPSSSSP